MSESPHEKSILIRENVLLAKYTTFGIGGPASFFTSVETAGQVAEAFLFAADQRLEVFILGGGSNILVSDNGFNGLVLRIGIEGTEFSDAGDGKVLLNAGAGEDWDQLVETAVNRDLAGFECLSGIPGSVGGTPVQNVGAYGQEISETIISVNCFDRTTGSIVEILNAHCNFSYRKSIFNSGQRGRYIVLSVKYMLTKKGASKIVYKDLKAEFPGAPPSLRQTREAVLRIRRSKSMVIDAADINSRSAGSFFKNPIVSTDFLAIMLSKEPTENVPFFAVDTENVKIPAAWLIENAGFHKGFRLGNAGISANHSLAIVNLGTATAADVVNLKDVIQKAVRRRFGIDLEPEPVFLGF